MVSLFPAPETTLVILLGASTWPRYTELEASQAFSNAARDVIKYFRDPQGFNLPQENLLNLFDSDEPNDMLDDSINQFLDKHIREKKREDGLTAKDVLCYFIGHGYISEGSSDFYLAIRRTRQNNPGISSLSIRGLAQTLKEQARFQRRVIILDCCFAAAAVKFYQGAGLIDIMRMQMQEALEEKTVGKGIPGRGTTFICSSSSKVRSRFLPDGNSTLFTQAWLHALRIGHPYQEGKALSLRVIHRLTVDFLLEKYGNKVPKPEIHSPDQSEGDVADIPFFPNCAIQAGQAHLIEKEQRRIAVEAEQARLAEEERRRGDIANIPFFPNPPASDLIQPAKPFVPDQRTRKRGWLVAALLSLVLLFGSGGLAIHSWFLGHRDPTSFTSPTAGGRSTAGPGLITTPTITEFPLASGSGPDGITAGPGGNLWFTEEDGNKIRRVSPNGTFTEFPIPTPGSQPSEITTGPDGNLWFTESGGNKIGRISPNSTFTEFPIQTASSHPIGITTGPDGNLWFAESSGNKIGRVSPNGTFTEFLIPTAGSHPIDIITGPDNNLWFTEFDGNKIGYITSGKRGASNSFIEIVSELIWLIAR